MIYTLITLPDATRKDSVTLEEFCKTYDCSIIVEEKPGKMFWAHLTGLHVGNGHLVAIAGREGGPGDPRYGEGLLPERAILDYLNKLRGRTVTSSQRGITFTMPAVRIGELEAVTRDAW